MSYYIRTKRGVPVPGDFTAKDGTPIVIDVYTRIAYFMFNNSVYPLAPTPSSIGAFSSGFSAGFS